MITLAYIYYYCTQCDKHGYFNKSQDTSYGRLTPKLTELVCLEGKDTSFRLATDKLQRILNIEVSHDTVLRTTETIGLNEFEKQTQALTGEELLECEESPVSEEVYVEIDGCSLNTTTDGWKEYKLALIFDKKDAVESGSRERTSISKKKLTGALAQGYEDLIPRLKRSLIESGAFGAENVILISDGSEWIEKVFQELVPGGTMILDWYHASEHLWDCAKDIFEDPEQAECWVEFYKCVLMHGCSDYMLERLLEKANTSKNQTPIRGLYSYFDTRRNKIKYKYFLERGYYIGSGAIESAHKYAIQARLKQAGMRWNIENANGVAQLRNSYFSDDWDNIWQKAA